MSDAVHVSVTMPDGSKRGWVTDAEGHHPDRILGRAGFFAAIERELDHAYRKHGREPWGRHEFYAILQEEVDELWDAIKKDEPPDRIRDEMVQVAAMCFRFFETGDRYAGKHSQPHIPDTEPSS